VHCGGRYAVKDKESAIECIDENTILRKIVPQVIEPNGGLFIALDDSDEAYVKPFVDGCQSCHIPIDELKPEQALHLEPNLNPKVRLAFWVPDGTFDPLRLAMAFAATAKSNGAKFKLFTDVTGLVFGSQACVTGVQALDRATNQRFEIHGDVVISATGAWAGEIAHMAGAEVPVKPTPGVMVAFDHRLVLRAINRLNAPGDGDIILPQRRLAVVGTTSYEVDNPDYVPVKEDDIKLMVERGAELVPAVRQAKMRGAYVATRPLVGGGTVGRSIARTFKCFDHKEDQGPDGIVTITGGKATTLRAMAEKCADVVCQKLGITAPCVTKEVPLISYRQFYAQPN
jgi:glycerol-3-phosphate dehydrogenase